MVHPKVTAPGTNYQYNELIKALEASLNQFGSDTARADNRIILTSMITSVICICVDRYKMNDKEIDDALKTGIKMATILIDETAHVS